MSEAEKDITPQEVSNIAATLAAEEVKSVTLKPHEKFTEDFNRKNYEDKTAMKKFKDAAYNGKKTIKDENGTVMHRSSDAAEKKYGKAAASRHTTQTDHIVSAKEAHQYAKDNNLNLSDGEIKKIINKKTNLQEISQRENQSKSSKSPIKHVVENKELSVEQKVKRTAKGVKEEIRVKSEMQIESAKNNAVDFSKKHFGEDVTSTGIQTGAAAFEGAKAGITTGAVVSAGKNIAAVAKGEKDWNEAMKDIAVDTLNSGIGGAGMGAGTELAKMGVKALSEQVGKQGVSNEISKAIGNSLKFVGEHTGAFVAAAVQVGNIFVRYANGEIDEADLIMDTGGAVTTVVAATIGATIGSAVPILGTAVGGFIGGLIGSIIGSEVCKKLKVALVGTQNTIESRKLKAMYDKMYEQVRKSREELEKYLSYIHAEQRANIAEGFKNMKQKLLEDDAEGAVGALADICAQFGVTLQFANKSEFDEFMPSDKPFVLGQA